MSRLRRLYRRLAEERGVTLVELLVATSVGTVVMLFSLNLVDGSMRASARIEDRVEVTQRGRVAMERITQQLRVQVCPGINEGDQLPRPPVNSATPTSVEFYSVLGNAARVTNGVNPDRRQLSYDATRRAIVESVWAGTGTAANPTWAATPTTHDIVRNVEPDPGVDMFRYYAFTTVDPIRPDQPLTATPLSLADRRRLVRIAVRFRVAPNRADHDEVRTTFHNSVYVRIANPADPQAGPQCTALI